MNKCLLSICVASLIVTSAQAVENTGSTFLKGLANAVATSNTNVNTTKTSTELSAEAKQVINSINNIDTKLKNIDSNVQKAFNNLVASVSSKQESADIKTKLNSINLNKNLTEAEKSAMISEIISNYANSLEKTQAEKAQALKDASNSKQVAFSNAITSLTNAKNEYVTIASDCRNVIKSITTKPSLVFSMPTELANLKNTSSVLKNNANSIKDLLTQSLAIAKSSGVNVSTK